VAVCKNNTGMSTSHREGADVADVNAARDAGPPAAGELW